MDKMSLTSVFSTESFLTIAIGGANSSVTKPIEHIAATLDLGLSRSFNTPTVTDSDREIDTQPSSSHDRTDGPHSGPTTSLDACRAGFKQMGDMTGEMEVQPLRSSSRHLSSGSLSSGFSSSGFSSSGSPTTILTSQAQLSVSPHLSSKLTDLDVRIQPHENINTIIPSETKHDDKPSQSSEEKSELQIMQIEITRFSIQRNIDTLHELCDAANTLDCSSLNAEKLGALANRIAKYYNMLNHQYTSLRFQKCYLQQDFDTLAKSYVKAKDSLSYLMDAHEHYMRSSGDKSTFVPIIMTSPPIPPSPTHVSIQGEKCVSDLSTNFLGQTVIIPSASSLNNEAASSHQILPNSLLTLSSKTISPIISTKPSKNSYAESITKFKNKQSTSNKTDSYSYNCYPLLSSSVLDKEVELILGASPLSIHKTLDETQVGVHTTNDACKDEHKQDDLDLEETNKMISSSLPLISDSSIVSDRSMDVSPNPLSFSKSPDTPNMIKPIAKRSLSQQVSAMLQITSPTRLPEKHLVFCSPKTYDLDMDNTDSTSQNVSLETQNIVRPFQTVEACPFDSTAVSTSSSNQTPAYADFVSGPNISNDFPSTSHETSSDEQAIDSGVSASDWDIEKNSSSFFFGVLHFSPTVNISEDKHADITSTAPVKLVTGTCTQDDMNMNVFGSSHVHCKEIQLNISDINCSIPLTPPVTPSCEHIDTFDGKLSCDKRVTPLLTPKTPISEDLSTDQTLEKHLIWQPTCQSHAHINPKIVKSLNFDSLVDASMTPSIQDEINLLNFDFSRKVPTTQQDLLESSRERLALLESKFSNQDKSLVPSFTSDNKFLLKKSSPPPKPCFSKPLSDRHTPDSQSKLLEVDLCVNSRGEREVKVVESCCGRISSKPTSSETKTPVECVPKIFFRVETSNLEKSSDLDAQIMGRNEIEDHLEMRSVEANAKECRSREKGDNKKDFIDDIFAEEVSIEDGDDLEKSLSCSNDLTLREILLRRRILRQQTDIQQRKEKFFRLDLKQLDADRLWRWISQSRHLYNKLDQHFDELEKLEVHTVEDCELRLRLEEESLEILGMLVEARETSYASQNQTSSRIETNKMSTLRDPINFSQFSIPQAETSNPFCNLLGNTNNEPSFLISNNSCCTKMSDIATEQAGLISPSSSSEETSDKELNMSLQGGVFEVPDVSPLANFTTTMNAFSLTISLVGLLLEVLSSAAIVTLQVVSELNGNPLAKIANEKVPTLDPNQTKAKEVQQNRSGLSALQDRRKPDLKNPAIRKEVIADIVGHLHSQRVKNMVLRSNASPNSVNDLGSKHWKQSRVAFVGTNQRKVFSTSRATVDPTLVDPSPSSLFHENPTLNKISLKNTSSKKHKRIKSARNSLLDGLSSKQKSNKSQPQTNVRFQKIVHKQVPNTDHLPRRRPPKNISSKTHPPSGDSPTGKQFPTQPFYHGCSSRKQQSRVTSVPISTYPSGTDLLCDPQVRKIVARSLVLHLDAISNRTKARLLSIQTIIN